MPNFRGSIILITGAGSGIGRATALALSKLNATLMLSDINLDSVKETASLCTQHASEVHVFKLDVGDTAACEEHVKSVVNNHGAPTHVFNCAGINPTAYALSDVTDEYYEQIMSVNLRGTFAITRAVLPHLSRGSTVTNVSSILGTKGAHKMAVYSASKWAVVGFTKSMAMELGPKGIRVNAIAPGYIDTPTNSDVVEGKEAMEASARKVPMGRLGTAEEVANAVVWLMSEEARYVSGSVVEINGGLA
jgi:NAD(P)-dependent dehydrogenase (short-subunit alcohol dehydrogenase family)